MRRSFIIEAESEEEYREIQIDEFSDSIFICQTDFKIDPDTMKEVPFEAIVELNRNQVVKLVNRLQIWLKSDSTHYGPMSPLQNRMQSGSI